MVDGVDDGYSSETPVADQMRDNFLQNGFDSFTAHLINDVRDQAAGDASLGAGLQQALEGAPAAEQQAAAQPQEAAE